MGSLTHGLVDPHATNCLCRDLENWHEKKGINGHYWHFMAASSLSWSLPSNRLNWSKLGWNTRSSPLNEIEFSVSITDLRVFGAISFIDQPMKVSFKHRWHIAKLSCLKAEELEDRPQSIVRIRYWTPINDISRGLSRLYNTWTRRLATTLEYEHIHTYLFDDIKWTHLSHALRIQFKGPCQCIWSGSTQKVQYVFKYFKSDMPNGRALPKEAYRDCKIHIDITCQRSSLNPLEILLDDQEGPCWRQRALLDSKHVIKQLAIKLEPPFSIIVFAVVFTINMGVGFPTNYHDPLPRHFGGRPITKENKRGEHFGSCNP